MTPAGEVVIAACVYDNLSADKPKVAFTVRVMIEGEDD